MKQLTATAFVGNRAEFGDGEGLDAAGIELAIATWGWKGHPHTNTPSCALAIQRDGSSPDWFVQGCIALLLLAYGSKRLVIVDEQDGAGVAGWLAACAYASKQSSTFAAGRSWVEAQLGSPLNISSGLVSQAQRLFG